MSAAIVAAVCTAFVTKMDPPPGCVSCPQFYAGDNNTYVYAGIMGVDFDCDYQAGGTCTYYQPDFTGHPEIYAACHEGQFINFNIAPKAKTANNSGHFK